MTNASTYTWNPDARTRAIGEAAAVRHQWARRTAAGEQVSPLPALRALHDAIVPPWPGISGGGMRRASARIGTESNDPHKAGIAIDFMVRSGPDRAANGESLATFLVQNMELLQLQYILWAGYEISTSSMGPRWEVYRGAEGHGDHLHVEIGPVAQGWTYGEMMSRVTRALEARNSSRRESMSPVEAGIDAVTDSARDVVGSIVSKGDAYEPETASGARQIQAVAAKNPVATVVVVVASLAGASLIAYAVWKQSQRKSNPGKRTRRR